MADAPWVKFYTGDFLHGVSIANLSAEEIGVYTVILMLIAEKGGPIDNDRQWIGRRAGANTRRAGLIIEKLIGCGKLSLDGDRLTNGRMMEEVSARNAKREQTSEAAKAMHAQKNGNLSRDYRPDNSGIKDGKNQDNIEINSGKPQKTAISDDANAHAGGGATRARDSELRDINTTHPIETEVGSEGEAGADGSGRAEPEKGRLEDADLGTLYDAVAEASGHNPSSPDQINRAYGFVEKWRKAGISFDLIVIPSIRAMVAESSEPTRTLGRFDARISHEHARAAAKGKTGKPYTPPPSPELIVSGEDAMFRPLRKALLDRLGPRTFATYVNRVRFEDVGEQPGGRHPIKVVDPMPGGLGLMDADRAAIVRACAKTLGFTEVW